jgi:4'-phosphopantetheinyl transferase
MTSGCNLEVWTSNLGEAPPDFWPWHLLTEEEVRRGGAYRSDNDGRRFALGRVMLRAILGLHLDRDPKSIALQVDRHGKPKLVEPEGKLFFNLSHSTETCVLAVCGSSEVGIDVEDTREVSDLNLLASSVLTPREREALEMAPLPSRDKLFLRCWTRKEALLKCAGIGLSVAPNLVDVSADAPMDSAAVALRLRDSQRHYRMWDLDLDEAVGAVAVTYVPGLVSLVQRRFDWSLSLRAAKSA